MPLIATYTSRVWLRMSCLLWLHGRVDVRKKVDFAGWGICRQTTDSGPTDSGRSPGDVIPLRRAEQGFWQQRGVACGVWVNVFVGNVFIRRESNSGDSARAVPAGGRLGVPICWS
ncbi:hypothetical protein EBU58_13310 [bacterium]|nr:hypothetical protein [bacterium]